MGAFEADTVVSDASLDADGKVKKYMVGMHMRGEVRARALEDSGKLRAGGPDRRHGSVSEADRDRDRAEWHKGDSRANFSQMYDDLSHELLAAFDGVLQPPVEQVTYGHDAKPKSREEGNAPHVPKFQLRRASC